MLPKPPVRNPQFGFIYHPPFRVQGFSVAGLETAVQVPELGVCFDIGRCPRPALTCPYVAISHGHMDHIAGIGYYFSHRAFMGLPAGTAVCHAALAGRIEQLILAWQAVEEQSTPHQIIPLAPDEELRLKGNTYLRGFETFHTTSAMGYVVLERRSRLLDPYRHLPQSQLAMLKQSGARISEVEEVPLVAYLGDTGPGDHLDREDIRNARIVITECTFTDPRDRHRAAIGKHLHLSDLAEMISGWAAEIVVITHVSLRSRLDQVRAALDSALPASERERVLLLMDDRANRRRYEEQRDAVVQAQQ